ncbi:DoxX family protein [Aureivirga sp. CE67]|uniref:DoxX family protein n=1 Tax=Aureivirga sp. CE67 TaxID=1788983 RepID=UPI0018CB882B|nr:DoxX family protein [Aureivirga sp. CE67]
MKKTKIFYWIFTILFSLSILAGAFLYFFQHNYAVQNFERLGFPSYLVYPLGTSKVLGIISILQKKSPILKNWAYAGFTLNLALAFLAHFMANDGESFGPIFVLVLMFLSYFFNFKLEKDGEESL